MPIEKMKQQVHSFIQPTSLKEIEIIYKKRDEWKLRAVGEKWNSVSFHFPSRFEKKDIRKQPEREIK